MVPSLPAHTKQPQDGHNLWGISSPCHIPMTKLRQFFKAGCAADLHAYSQGAGLCPSPRPQGSPPQVLDKLCTSALTSATKALLHVPPDTSPSCLPHPMTMRRYSQTQMQSVGTQGLCQLTLEHVTAATSLRVLFRGMTVIPMTPTTHTEWHNAAHFPPCLPAGTVSVDVLCCVLALQEWAAWSSQADAVQGER